MVIKIIAGVLLLVASVMGLKQGFLMMSGSPQMMDIFSKWGLGRTAVMAIGLVTFLSALMILIPRSFLWGNWLMAATILLLVCFHLQHGDFKGVLLELPFLSLNLVLVYLQHPLVWAN